MSEWHPIETAPRDGTVILVYDDLFGHQIASWNRYSEWIQDEMPTTEGWQDGLHPIVGDSGEPTHWMPLPDPPEDT